MSPLLKARVSGAWVDTEATGAVRLGGVTVPFGPEPGGPTLESVTWPDPPTLTNADDNTTYTMGIRFSLVTAKLCYGITWRVPDAVAPTQFIGDHLAALWEVAGETRLAAQVFTPVPGGEQQILFAEPVALSAGPVQYVASVHTRRYVFRNGGGVWPTSPSGNVVTDQGKLVADSPPTVYPGGTFGTPWYYVSPLVEV